MTGHQENSSENRESLAPAFDYEALLERLNGQHLLVSELVSLAAENFPPDYLSLKQAIANREHSAAANLAHRMKGRYLMIGGMPTAHVLEQLEEALVRSGQQILDRLMERLDEEHHRFLQVAQVPRSESS
ncbi:MAG: Hpt domain-containing protein [Planctomycetaceae bacterium]